MEGQSIIDFIGFDDKLTLFVVKVTNLSSSEY